jgi:dipeptidyl aminopeptidase/acylaminoacyl peptidase
MAERDRRWKGTNHRDGRTGFRVLDDEYVIYTSMAGEIRGARLDPETMEVGRSVALVTGVRREPYMGVGQFDASDAGTLVYVPGVNAGVGQLVEKQVSQEPSPLSVDPAEFLRFDISPGGDYLAVVLEGVVQEELHVFDLAGGPGQLMLEAFSISEPLWTPDGDSVVVSVEDAGRRVAIVAGSRTGGGALDTIVTDVQVGPLSYHPSSLVVGHDPPRVISIDRSVDPVRVDTLMTDAYFPVLADDGRWLAYQPDGEGSIMLTRLPELDLRIPVADGFEPQWTSSEELLFWTFEEGFFRVSVDTEGEVRVGRPRPWFVDRQFLDTPGQSYTLSGDGTAVYVRGLHPREGSYLRVIPNWVEQMKREVDAASR